MIIHRYILKNHLFPFLFSIITLIAVFLLQFLMKFADRLIGKGLSFVVILKLIIYNLAWMVVLVVPMSVLIATIMAFGSMAQNNEIAVLKSAGVSLYRMMIAPLIASVILAYGLVLFNNHVYPNANHAARIMLQDISRKKPMLSLVPGVFSREVPNYSILARQVDSKSNRLKTITIYDYSNPLKVNIITAESGKIYFSKNQKKLILDLTNGEIHQSNRREPGEYRKIVFVRHKIAMDASEFTFHQSSLSGPRGDRELSAGEIQVIVDSLKRIRKKLLKYYQTTLKNYIEVNNLNYYNRHAGKVDSSAAYIAALNSISSAQSLLYSRLRSLEINKDETDSYLVEWHKKYSIPVACIIFILIGAPLGTMARKGGFGMAAGISLFFFTVYWAFLIGGEKLADRGMLSPLWGMWSANILLGILGIFLTIKSANEKVTIDFSFLKKFIPKRFIPQNED